MVGLLCEELPQLKTFATLSPVPRFAAWLRQEQEAAGGDKVKIPSDPELKALAARYLVTARSPKGMVLDSVARFHLGNGARLEAIHTGADTSANGLRQSHGVMVNYIYDIAEIEENHFALAELGIVAASKAVRVLAGVEPDKDGKSGKRAA